MELIKLGIGVVFVPQTLLLIFFGTVIGVIFGALPGVSASMAVVLGLTFTYGLDPVTSIAFLVAVYCAAITGGGITAILFKIPGTPSSAPTTFDGHPMAQNGQPMKALSISLICSSIGGIFAAIAMFLISPQLSTAALKFGPSELFAISFMGLSVLTALDEGNVLKTLISGLLGLWLATVGMDPIDGFARFTWGNSTLLSGIEMIPVMIGMFAITQILKETKDRSKLENLNEAKADKKNDKIVSVKELWDIRGTIARTGIMGTIVGILPGAGATIASFLSYTTEVKMSKHPETFGKGEIRGIAASETANNAATGGSMVPLLSLGIPGGNAAAIMMSALVMKGVQMGPLLLQNQPEYMGSVFVSMIITNIAMVFVSFAVAKVFGKILGIPYSILGTLIILLAVIGSYALQNTTGNVMLMIIAGIIGFAFAEFGFNNAALILGLVLGTMVESNLRRAIMIEQGNITAVFTKPITATLMVVSAVSLLWPIVKPMIMKNRKAAN
ncbi:MAG: trap-t family transporter [Sedimentibacter sp.]|jgi:putative tricarboxylic transport membrane protein|nr:trap-t family transporter [Sedimentibacter sp.]